MAACASCAGHDTYDQLSRSPDAKRALSKYSGQTAVLVGVGYSDRSGIEERRKSYQLLPSAAGPPRLIEIAWSGDGEPVVHDVGANWTGFLLGSTLELAVLVVVFKMWRRDLRAPSNTSPGRTREG